MAPKKKTAKKTRPANGMVVPYQEKKCVRITEADNGFSVSTYGPKGEKCMVARSEAEAMRHAKTLLKEK